jgi:tRNA 2-thiouridine synthesizing protein A
MRIVRHNRGIVTTVDARGLACPLPLALAKQSMTALAPGETLLVLATDPEAPIDLGAWAAEEGHGLRVRRREGWSEYEVVKRVTGSRVTGDG